MLEAYDVAFSYGRNHPVLKSVETHIEPGSFLAILGVNGCGKSTLLSCLNALLSPARGSILLDGKEVAGMKREERAQRISFVAQHDHANRLTVFDVLLMGRMPFMKAAPNDEDVSIVNEVLREMDMEDKALRYADELSGGEYQKVMLARAFVQQTPVLLLDEPTNNLDPANQQEVLRLVRDAVGKRQVAAAAVMHDINLALRFCDRFLLLKDGGVLAYGDESVIDEVTVEELYGVMVDIIEHRGRRLVVAR